jgi:S1-C subfamily serine protease
VVGDGLVATAGHTVEGALRDLTVDGTPGRVLALDRRTDLALLAVPGVGRMIPAPPMADAAPETAVVVGPGGNVDVRLVRTGALTVHDTTDRRRYRRRVHTFTPGVPDGTSGAPLVDAQGRVLGVVVIDNPRRGVAYAVTAAELARVLAGDMHPRAIPATNCGD